MTPQASPPSPDWPDGNTSLATPAAHPTLNRAARMLWITGVVLCLCFGCCSGWAWAVSAVPMAEIERWVQQSRTDNSDALLQQFRQMAPHLRTIALAAAALGLLPGVGYLLLGFPVRRGHRAATVAGFVLTGTQSCVAGLMFMGGLFGTLIAGDPMGMTFVVLTWGSLTGLLFYTAWSSLRALRPGAPAAEHTTDGPEPWALG